MRGKGPKEEASIPFQELGEYPGNLSYKKTWRKEKGA
jgi:hypothetical protein